MPSTQPSASQVTRRSFLKTAAAAGAALATPGLLSSSAQAAGGKGIGRNLIFFLTDQERTTQWFPAGWEEANLPGLMRLKQSGITFTNACVNTAMCTPSRSSIFTGTFPTQNGCTDTLTEGFPQSATEHQLNPNLPNLATILKSQGYDVYYKGKWHLSTAVHDANGNIVHDDLSRYGFEGWDAPDAGQDTASANYGGGDANHDGRFFEDAMDFLEDRIANPSERPFCLIISLVNPHDVLGYPGLGISDDWNSGGYTVADLMGNLPLPPTVDENLVTNQKPTAQSDLLPILIGLGPLATTHRKERYYNFYANLIKLNDEKVVQLLDLLEGSAAGLALRQNTWIVRTSDHGEMGLSHQGMRQKAFQCYEESLRVPLIWSNTADFPYGTGVDCPHLVSHVDFLPTVCTSLLGMRDWRTNYALSGVDYSALLTNPRSTRPVQDYILFTYDDVYAAGSAETFPDGGAVTGANRIEAVRTRDFKYVRYYDATGVVSDQEEFYDLRTAAQGGTDTDAATGQPLEMINYSDWAQSIRSSPLTIPRDIAQQKSLLKRTLTQARRRLVPLDPGPLETPTVKQELVTVLATGEDALEISWYSLATMEYQLQRSTNGGLSWEDLNDPVFGNNGPIMLIINDLPTGAIFQIDAYPAA